MVVSPGGWPDAEAAVALSAAEAPEENQWDTITKSKYFWEGV